MTSQDTQNSNSSRNAEELSGMVCALLSGILFGTMPLATIPEEKGVNSDNDD